MNTHARLVILDEALRGLDRSARRRLLDRSRALWTDVTMLCVTHDVSDTRSFDRVLVVDNGRIVEDGSPSVLAIDRESHYHQMLAEEHAVQQMWTSQAVWRRINVDGGAVAPAADHPRSEWHDERSHSYVASR